MDRDARIDAFLAAAGWRGAVRRPLAGDASNRRYERITGKDRTAVLMDADPAKGEDTASFVAIGTFLTDLGLHAPQILAQNSEQGFLLLEDLGDRLFARAFEADPETQLPYYTAALDVLRQLHAGDPPALPAYGAAEMGMAAGLATTWYAGQPNATLALQAEMTRRLQALDWTRQVPVLRDYHAENLIWCAGSTPRDTVGLLDFQDAALGHPVYDVASLLQDARRDVPRQVVTALKDASWSWFAGTRPEFDQAFAVLATQRALRILGVFARLSLHFGKPHYVDLIPRVWGQLHSNLSDPALDGLAEILDPILPPPTLAHLADLKARAGSCPMR